MLPEYGSSSEEHDPSPDRSSRLDDAIQLLEAGVDEILTSEGFQRYLDLMSRLHDYSHGNLLLILAQNPDATMVAGYRRWQQLGRQVRRGERGIRILVPYKRRLDDGNETQDEQDPSNYVICGFGIRSVFDVSQTDGEPLPEPPVVEEIRASSDAAQALTSHLEQFLEQPGISVVREDTRPAIGYYAPSRRLIALDHSLEGIQTCKTLCHETAHFVADHLPGAVHRRDAETVAEASAYVVLQHYAIDSGTYSFPYVARWAEDRGVLNRNLSAIQRVATTIIDGIEGETDGQGTAPRKQRLT